MRLGDETCMLRSKSDVFSSFLLVHSSQLDRIALSIFGTFPKHTGTPFPRNYGIYLPSHHTRTVHANRSYVIDLFPTEYRFSVNRIWCKTKTKTCFLIYQKTFSIQFCMGSWKPRNKSVNKKHKSQYFVYTFVFVFVVIILSSCSSSLPSDVWFPNDETWQSSFKSRHMKWNLASSGMTLHVHKLPHVHHVSNAFHAVLPLVRPTIFQRLKRTFFGRFEKEENFILNISNFGWFGNLRRKTWK